MRKPDHNSSCPADSQSAVKRITWIGLWINLFLSAVKITVGWFGSSQAVIADGVHSLSDLVTDIAVIFGVSVWSAPADADHPYGHGRIEAMVTLFISGALLAVGIGIGYSAITGFMSTEIPKSPSIIAAAGSFFSIIFKEILYRRTMVIAHREKSTALAANAWHHRSDAISSIPALAAVGAAVIEPSLYFVDGIGAVVVSIFIIKVSFDLMKPSLLELSDRGAAECDMKLMHEISSSVKGVMEVHALRSRKVGQGSLVDLHVLVDDELTVKEGHFIAHEVKRLLLEKGPDVIDAVIHLEPYSISTRGGSVK
jgi:cation diffusion facilitator family transporter